MKKTIKTMRWEEFQAWLVSWCISKGTLMPRMRFLKWLYEEISVSEIGA